MSDQENVIKENQEKAIKDGQVSELQVMKSAAGYYVGRESYDKQLDTWIPHNRVSDYEKSPEKAEKVLAASQEYQKKLRDVAMPTIKSTYHTLSMDTPESRLKRNLINDSLQHDKAMQPKPIPNTIDR